MKNCLVCGKVGLAEAAEKCPQCGADLECFKLLDTLHEEAVIREVSQEIVDLKEQTKAVISSLDTIHETSNTPKNNAWPHHQWMLFLVIILLTVWLVYRDWIAIQQFNDRIEQVNLQIATVAATQKSVLTKIDTASAEQEPVTAPSHRLITLFDQRLETVKKMLTVMMDQRKSIGNDLESMGEASSAFSKPHTPSDPIPVAANQKVAGSNDDNAFYYYPSQGHETLWSIAKRHYGNGVFYPLLLEYNPGLGIYNDSGSKSLKILKDRKKATAQLRALIVKTDEGSLLRYRVAPGDRWSVLSKRFYGNGTQTARLIALNDNAPLTVDTRILIPLLE